MRRTAPYRAWVRRSAEEQSIPVVPAPTGQRTEAVVAPDDRRFQEPDGVVGIRTSVEQGRTFVSSTPRDAPPRGDPTPPSRLIDACRTRVLHADVSLSLVDPVLGPMRLRVATVLPVTRACFRTGQSRRAHELTCAGVALRTEDTAFCLPRRGRRGGAGGRQRAGAPPPPGAARRPLGTPPGPVLPRGGAGGTARGRPRQPRPDRTGDRRQRHALRTAEGVVPPRHGAGDTPGRRRPDPTPVRPPHHGARRWQTPDRARPAHRRPADPALVVPALVRHAGRQR